jgi:hypothetical protein
MSPLAFALRYVGQRVTALGGDGGQCVDLANLWIANCCRLSHVYRNAIDWAGPGLERMRWVANSPYNAPMAGAVVVWQATPELGIGVFGHIALVLVADENVLVTLDQNWVQGEICALNLHSYTGVLGWQVPSLF